MEKLKAIFDNRATWATMGVFAGSLFGEQAGAIVGAVGSLVMAVL